MCILHLQLISVQVHSSHMRLMATGVDPVVPRESDHGCWATPNTEGATVLFFAPLSIVGQFSFMRSSAHARCGTSVEMVAPGREGEAKQEVTEGERALKEQGCLRFCAQGSWVPLV